MLSLEVMDDRNAPGDLRAAFDPLAASLDLNGSRPANSAAQAPTDPAKVSVLSDLERYGFDPWLDLSLGAAASTAGRVSIPLPNPGPGPGPGPVDPVDPNPDDPDTELDPNPDPGSPDPGPQPPTPQPPIPGPTDPVNECGEVPVVNDPVYDGDVLELGRFRIGDTVWLDDGDGKHEAGEQGIDNVIVKLYRSYDDNPGSEVCTTVTDSNGHYEFIVENCYGSDRFVIEFVLGEHFATKTHAPGTTNSNDSDVDANGFTRVFGASSEGAAAVGPPGERFPSWEISTSDAGFVTAKSRGFAMAYVTGDAIAVEGGRDNIYLQFFRYGGKTRKPLVINYEIL